MKFSGLARALPLALLGGALGSNHRALENKELRQLDRIMKGEVGKDELEIVLAQYDEDLSWSRPYDKVATVYCKGGDQCAPNSERLANVGREGHTFLHHIVKNYDNLAAWTVFSQAEEPTDGYRGQNQGGGHMLTGATFDDYLLHPQRSTAEDPEAFFLITSKVHLATLQHSLRSTFKTADGQQIAVASALPPMCPIHDASTGSTDTWRPYVQAPWLQTFVTDKCGLEPDIMGEALMSFWDAYLELPRPAANIAHYAQGARFAASRARIQQRSKLFYEKLLALVSTEQDPCMNYLYEWVWYYIIGKPESAACTVTEDEIQRTWAVEHRMLSGGVSGVSGVSGISGVSGSPTPAPTKAPTPAPTKAPAPAPTKAPTPAPTKAPGVDKPDVDEPEVAKPEVAKPVPEGVQVATVITGSVSLSVEDPVAFCANDAVNAAFAATMANVTGLPKEWFAVECVAKLRRLSQGNRRLAGTVDMEFAITIPPDAPAASTPTTDSIKSSVSSSTPASLTAAFTKELKAAGVEVVVEVTAIAPPVAKSVTLTTTGTTTGTLLGASDSGCSTISLGLSSMLAILLAAFFG